ncbi:alpha/beta fold hydrolase [Brevibacterium litoralis]|uniref:alpha/beta fold hydrolase n=1 Tax=Brevibacterium litoralis TaxID=3138935 RepID=UPI0032EBEA82
MTQPHPSARRLLLSTALGASALVGTALAAAGGFAVYTSTYAAIDRMRAERAGFVTGHTLVNGHDLHFAEGPDNGPALLLVPGQGSDLWNYARVMRELARDFHVFVLDVPGHGESDFDTDLYHGPVLGELFADFVAGVIGEQAIVAGHSSGGLVAAWMGAARPEVVAALVLEDPPFFSSEHPRAERTWNHVDLATAAHGFVGQDPDPERGEAEDPEWTDDFVEYYLRTGRFFTLFGDLEDRLRTSGIRDRQARPDVPVTWPYMSPVMNEMMRGLDSYDPAFGEAFHSGSFHHLFDHATTLSAISVPTLLIACDWRYDETGILLAAMDDEDADRAFELVPDAEFLRVSSGHGFHFEHPRDYVEAVRTFTAAVVDEVQVFD